VTLHPKFHNCTFGGETAATVDTGGCNFIVDSDTTQASGHSSSSEHAAVSLECEGSHAIKITTSVCNLEIETEQSGGANHSLHGVRYSKVLDSSVSAVTVTATVRTLRYTVLSGSLCTFAGLSPGAYANGSFDGLIGLTGFEHGSSTGGSTTNGFTWSHGARTDISVD
jgi:hypothetical protein